MKIDHTDLRIAEFKDIEKLVEIRSKAILAQPATIWSKEHLRQVADFYGTQHFTNEFPQLKHYILEDYAFVANKFDYLSYLFILPEYQGKGIGAKLLGFIESKMREEGASQSWLWAHPYAEKFYENHGYSVNGEVYAPFGNDLKKMIKRF